MSCLVSRPDKYNSTYRGIRKLSFLACLYFPLYLVLALKEKVRERKTEMERLYDNGGKEMRKAERGRNDKRGRG